MGAVFIDNSQLTIKIYTTMEEFWKKMRDDLKKDGITSKDFWFYGVVGLLFNLSLLLLSCAIDCA